LSKSVLIRHAPDASSVRATGLRPDHQSRWRCVKRSIFGGYRHSDGVPRGRVLAPAALRFPRLINSAFFLGSVSEVSGRQEVFLARGRDEDAGVADLVFDLHHCPRRGVLAAKHRMKPIEAAVLRLCVKLPIEVLIEVPGAQSRSASPLVVLTIASAIWTTPPAKPCSISSSPTKSSSTIR